MSTAEANPYKVLGVERTADVRAIKKAYVALIRKFTPEAHPEEFKKIRAAYELLSDEDARARFDDGEKGYAEYGEDVAKRIADADEALGKQQPELAREILLELAGKAPETVVVREKLAFSFLNGGEHEQALAEFDFLAKKEPENARHHLHRALALNRLERQAEVEVALEEARRLDPKDARIALATCDYYAATGRSAEALAVVDATVPLLPPGSGPVFILVLRKVETCALEGNVSGADRAIEELEALVSKASDPELGGFVASQLGSVAAKLFGSSRASLANHLLRRCERFDAASKLLRPVASETVIATRDLPTELRAWLEDVARDETHPFALRGRGWFLPALAVLVSVGAWAAAYETLRAPDASFGVVDVLFTFFLLAVPIAFLLISGRWVLRLLSTPLRSLTTLHPLYVIHATPSRTRVFSLFALDDVKGVHQHTNGVYTGTQLTLIFGGPEERRSFTLSIRGKELAQRWLEMLSAVRARGLELLAEGALEAEPLVDVLPPGVLASLPTGERLSARELTKPLLLASAVAALLVPVVGWSNTRAAEDAAFGAAASKDTVAGYREYVAAHAGSRHAPLAKELLKARITKLADEIPFRSADPGRDALARAALHVREHGGAIVIEDLSETTLAKAHVERALGASGLSELVANDGDVRVKVSIRAKDGVSLARVPNADAVLPKPAVLGSLVLASAAGSAKSSPVAPAELTARAYEVEVTVEVPGDPPFVAKRETVPEKVTHATSARPEAAQRMLDARAMEAALDAVTDALGLLGPKARLASGSRP